MFKHDSDVMHDICYLENVINSTLITCRIEYEKKKITFYKGKIFIFDMDDIEKLCVGQTKRLYFEDECIGSFEIEKIFND